MIRKILIGTMLVVLVGVLVFGAVNRTIAKSDQESKQGYTSQGVSRGGGRSAGAQIPGLGEPEGEDNFPLESDVWQSDEGGQSPSQGQDGAGQGRGRGGQGNSGQGRNRSGSEGSGQAEVQEWINLTGTVASQDSELLVVTSQDGQTIEIEGRALRFIQEQGFSLQTGDAVMLNGFFDSEGRLEVALIENQSNGTSLAIRDSSGRPYWAGRGRQGS